MLPFDPLLKIDDTQDLYYNIDIVGKWKFCTPGTLALSLSCHPPKVKWLPNSFDFHIYFFVVQSTLS